jgi:DNA polymerase III alpha subunit
VVAVPASLHTHSWYSLLEGTADPAALLARAAACGCTALALTDTNNLYGAAVFADAALGLGVRPLLGACLRHRRERCVALIADTIGYANLCRVLSRLHLGPLTPDPSPQGGEGRKRPAGLADLLNDCADGLHVLAGDAVLAERLRGAFGSRLWLEVVRPPRSAKQERELLDAGRRLGLRPVASTAAHFATPDEYPAFRLVTAVRQTTLLERVPPQLAVTPDHHLVEEAELRRRFRDLPEAVRNAEVLADRLGSDVLPRELILPEPRPAGGLDSTRRLRQLCEEGLRRRPTHDAGRAPARLAEELALIEAAGLPGYFLVVRDIARYARSRGHSMAVRGSAGNSLVCYLLDITDVDPLRFGLSLERFLHAGRRDLPDIDLDFDWKVRDDVIDHVRRTYGPAYTAQIASHLFLQPRSAFRESAKIHGLSNEQVSQLLERLDERVDGLLSVPPRPGTPGRGTGGEGGLGPQYSVLSTQTPHPRPLSPQGRGEEGAPAGFPLEPGRWPLILADARRLLGRPHHLSIHPGGVVITPRPIEGYAPLQMAPKGVVITQFEKDAVERVGLVKIDLLGNRALATVDEARSLVNKGSGTPRSQAPLGNAGREAPLRTPRSLPSLTLRAPWEADPATLALLRAGDTLGVNQLESPAMRHLLIQMRPDGLDDVIQALALLRPGAASVGMKELFLRRRRGLEPVEAHPLLEPLLRPTQGLMLYEDDALRVVRALTGLTVVEADRVRKLAAREHPAEQERRLAEEFVAACAGRGVARAVAEEQWRQLTRFRHYTFCKSHAVSYGLIAWRAAYLKAHYPLAFWTAALNNNQGAYPRRVYVEAAKRAGLRLLLPCANRSRGPFTLEGGAIRAGLGAIAGLGRELLESLLAERDRGGPYRDLADLRRRVRPGPEALALLIGCGALDFTGQPRPALFLEADLRDTETGQAGLFAAEPDGWSPNDYGAERRLRDEWRLLGFVVGPSLMSLFRPKMPRHLVTSRDLPRYVGRRVHVAGVTATARHTRTARGKPMQFVTLEDEWGLIEVTLFPGTCPPAPYLTLGPYLAAGTVEERYGVLALNARRFQRQPVPILSGA